MNCSYANKLNVCECRQTYIGIEFNEFQGLLKYRISKLTLSPKNVGVPAAACLHQLLRTIFYMDRVL